MSTESMTLKQGDQWPGMLPEYPDGSPFNIPVVLKPWPLKAVMPVDVNAAHEQALMRAGTDGEIRRLICFQAHQRTLTHDDTGIVSWLPVLQISLYLRDSSGPIHRPLHWLAVSDVSGLGDPALGVLEDAANKLGADPSKGMPCQLIITGQQRKVLLIANLAMHNLVANYWRTALTLSASHAELDPDDFVDQAMRAEHDLCPMVARSCCMRQLMPVAIGGQHYTVQGGQVRKWLIDQGWLHPKQVACDDAAGGAR